MYCPHCGRPLDEVGGVLTCVAGRMPLGRILQAVLTARFPVQNERSHETEVGRKPGQWFCPACGVPLKDMACPYCGRSLQDLLHQLVELHPHELI